MSGPPHNLVADIRGASRLAFEAGINVTDLVESMHGTIAGVAGWVPGASIERTRGITALVYRCVGGGIRLAGGGLDRVLQTAAALAGTRARPASLETALAVVNGAFGDHLAATRNPLAISMHLRLEGAPLALDAACLRQAIRGARGRVLIQVHGLGMHPGQWARDGRDHAAALAGDLGYTSLHLQYNTGLHIAANGRALAGLLETLVAAWPVPLEELAIVGHSMGGLVARSAHYYGKAAGHAWPARLRKLVFLGTPHHGAPLERAGNGLDALLAWSPYTRPFTRIGRARSHGIADLRFGILLEDDWGSRDPYAPMRRDPRTALPLPAGVDCFAVAGVRAERHESSAARLLGDGLVPLASALGEHREKRLALDFPAGHRWVGTGLGHLDLLSSPAVFVQLGRWLAP